MTLAKVITKTKVFNGKFISNQRASKTKNRQFYFKPFLESLADSKYMALFFQNNGRIIGK